MRLFFNCFLLVYKNTVFKFPLYPETLLVTARS